MANTNRPSTNTHQTIIIPPYGGSIVAPTAQFRYLNCYPVVHKQIGKDPSFSVRRRPPAVSTLRDTSTALTEIHSAWWDSDDSQLWFTSGKNVYRRVATNPYIEDTDRLMDTIFNSNIVHYRVGDTDLIAIMENGQEEDMGLTTNKTKVHFYHNLFKSWEETLELPLTVQTTSMVFLDGYLFFSGTYLSTSQRIYNTSIGDHMEMIEDVNYVDAEMEGDRLVCIAKHHNHIVAFGQDSIEFFYNSSNEIGSPLSRQTGYAMNIGIFNPGVSGLTSLPTARTQVEINDDLFFIAAKNRNVLGLYRLSNFKAQKISDSVLDKKIRGIKFPRLSTFDLNGEICVFITDEDRVATPIVFIPSLELAIEVSYIFYPELGVVSGSFGSYNTLLLRTDGVSMSPLYSGGSISFDAPGHPPDTFTETVTSEILVDYQDFNNNARKHWNSVDVLGSFGQSFIQLEYANDSYGFDSSKFVTFPYITPIVTDANRFRNLGMSRRQAYRIRITGSTDYVYKGLSVNYNQWGV